MVGPRRTGQFVLDSKRLFVAALASQCARQRRVRRARDLLRDESNDLRSVSYPFCGWYCPCDGAHRSCFAQTCGFSFKVPVMLVFSIVSCTVALVAYVLVLRAQSKPNKERFSWSPAWAEILEQGGRSHDLGLVLTRAGVTYQFEYIHASEGSDSIRICRDIQPSQSTGALPELPTMRLREETDLDELGKALKLNKELQTHDASFDRRVYIECDARGDTASRMLQSPTARQAVCALLALGFQQIEFRRHQHALSATWTVGGRTFDAQLIDQSIAQLVALVDALPAFREVPKEPQKPAGYWLLLASVGCNVLAGALYVCGELLWPPVGTGLQGLSMMSPFVMFAVVFVLCVAVLRGTSTALRSLVYCSFVNMLTVAFLGPGVVTVFNGFGDSQITSYERRLDHKSLHDADSRGVYFFHFPAIPGVSSSLVRLPVSESIYEEGQKGDVYALTVGAGKLGVPWLKELQKR